MPTVCIVFGTPVAVMENRHHAQPFTQRFDAFVGEIPETVEPEEVLVRQDLDETSDEAVASLLVSRLVIPRDRLDLTIGGRQVPTAVTAAAQAARAW